MTDYPEPQERTLKRYNLTREAWWALFGDGICPLCEKPYIPGDFNRRAVIDHDHRSGKVRGMLCAADNYDLGLHHDNAGWLERAANYLKNPPTSMWDFVPRVDSAPPVIRHTEPSVMEGDK